MKLKKIRCFLLIFLVLCSLVSAPLISHASSSSAVNPFFFLHSYNTVIEKMLGGKAEYPFDANIAGGEGYCTTRGDSMVITFAGGEGQKCEIKKIIINGFDDIDVRTAAAWIVFKTVETPGWMDKLDNDKLSNEINNAAKKIINSTKSNPYKLCGYNFYYIYPTSKTKAGIAIENQKYYSDKKTTAKPTPKITSTPKPTATPKPTSTPIPTATPFPYEQYKTLEYKTYSRNPEKYVNQEFEFTGNVLQVLGNRREGYTIRIATKGSYEDIVLVKIYKDPGYAILEGDNLTVYASANETYTYESTTGREVTLPFFVAHLIKLNE